MAIGGKRKLVIGGTNYKITVFSPLCEYWRLFQGRDVQLQLLLLFLIIWLNTFRCPLKSRDYNSFLAFILESFKIHTKVAKIVENSCIIYPASSVNTLCNHSTVTTTKILTLVYSTINNSLYLNFTSFFTIVLFLFQIQHESSLVSYFLQFSLSFLTFAL